MKTWLEKSEIGSKGMELAGQSGRSRNVWKYLEMSENGWKWLEMAKMAGIGWKLLELSLIGWNWLKTSGNCLKWLEMSANGKFSISEAQQLSSPAAQQLSSSRIYFL